MEITEEIKKLAVNKARLVIATMSNQISTVPDILLVSGFLSAFNQRANDPTAALAALAIAIEICRRFGDGKVFIEEDKGGDKQTITE